MSRGTTRTATQHRRPPQMIQDDLEGTRWMLATTEAEALAAAKADQEDEFYEVRVTFAGWMQNIGWDRESFETKREFLALSGYKGWWDGIGGAIDAHEETAKLRRAFEVDVRARDGSDD